MVLCVHDTLEPLLSNLVPEEGGGGWRRRHKNLENNLSQVQHSEDSPVPADVLLIAI